MKASAIGAIIVVAVLGTLIGGIFLARDQFRGPELPRYGKSPSFQLVDSQNKAFTSESLRNIPHVMNFFFSHCEAVCPTTNRAMARVARNFTGTNLRFLSVSVDPQRDTPDALTEYATKFNADSEQWMFLTGPKAEVDRMLTELKLGTSEDIAQHTSRLVLIDGRGEVRGYYQGTDDEAIETLKRDIRTLARTSEF